MKRFALVLPCLLFLSGCAQVFDGNLFKTVDSPPPLNTANLAKSSTADIKTMAQDPSFYQQLKDDPAALTAVQKALSDSFTNATNNQDRMDAATTMVDVTANSTAVADIKTTLVNNLSTISNSMSSGNYAAVFKLFLGNQTEPEIEATLNTFLLLASVLESMQTVATDPVTGKVNSAIFFSGTSDPTGFSETALMATIAMALIADFQGTTPGVKLIAAELALDTPVLPSHADMSAFTAAKNGDLAVNDGTGIGATTYAFHYAYMSAVNSKLTL